MIDVDEIVALLNDAGTQMRHRRHPESPELAAYDHAYGSGLLKAAEMVRMWADNENED